MGKMRRGPPVRPERKQLAGPPDPEQDDAAPGRIHGATITSWNGPPTVDLTELFARGTLGVSPGMPLGVSVAGGSSRSPAAEAGVPRQTVCLSDGTEITFIATDRFTVKETA